MHQQSTLLTLVDGVFHYPPFRQFMCCKKTEYTINSSRILKDFLKQMHQPRSFLLHRLLLISVLVSLLPPSSCDDEEYMRTGYRDCSKRSFLCGNFTINVSYPFFEKPEKSYCGHPEFELTCNFSESAITIHVGKDHYRVVGDINYSKHQLTIADESFFSESCYRPSPYFHNDSQLNYSIDLNVLVYFWNCSSSVPQLSKAPCLSYDNLFYSLNSYPVIPIPSCRFIGVIWMVRTAQELMKDSYDKALQEGFIVGWTSEVWQDCGKCMSDDGVCGSDNFTHASLCFFPNGTVTRSSSRDGDIAGSRGHVWPIAASVSGVIGFFLISAGLIVLCVGKKNRSKPRNIPDINSSKPRNIPDIQTFLKDYESLAPKRYSYADLKLITKSFSTKLGKGGFGTVYQGQLKDGRQVAVKILSKSKDNGADFMNEVAGIGRTSHVNIVSLLGFCVDGRRRALVYEFMANGSLEKYIYSDEPKAFLPWDKLFQLAIGVARGLEYLHRGCNTRIVHFDIKPHNVLLDADFCPKISDFGLAKLCTHKESKLSMAGARGTIGYIAPEVFSRQFGPVTTKSDVYSYGMMVLEMVGGRRNVKECDKSSEVYFPHWVYEHLDRDEDLLACDVEPETKGIARKMILVGLWCIQATPANRPSMSRVVEMLEGSVGNLEMPPKPYISSPVRSAVQSPVQSFVDYSSSH